MFSIVSGTNRACGKIQSGRSFLQHRFHSEFRLVAPRRNERQAAISSTDVRTYRFKVYVDELSRGEIFGCKSVVPGSRLGRSSVLPAGQGIESNPSRSITVDRIL